MVNFFSTEKKLFEIETLFAADWTDVENPSVQCQSVFRPAVKVRHRAYCTYCRYFTDSTKNIALCTKSKPPYRILHKEHFTLHNVKVTHIEYCTYCPKNIALCTMSKSPYRILRTEHKEYCTLHLAQRQSHTKNSAVDRFAVKEGL